MNTASKKAILKVFNAIEGKIASLEEERDKFDYGSWEYKENDVAAFGLRQRLQGMSDVLSLIAPDSGPMKGFGWRVKNGAIVQRVGAITAEDIVQYVK